MGSVAIVFFKGKKNGTTLVELLISIGMLSAVLLFGVEVYRNSLEATRVFNAKTLAEANIEQTRNFFRQFFLQKMFNGLGDAGNLNIKLSMFNNGMKMSGYRHVRVPAGANVIYQPMEITQECQSLAAIESRMAQNAFATPGLAAELSSTLSNFCPVAGPSQSCPAGQYRRMHFKFSNVGVAVPGDPLTPSADIYVPGAPPSLGSLGVYFCLRTTKSSNLDTTVAVFDSYQLDFIEPIIGMGKKSLSYYRGQMMMSDITDTGSMDYILGEEVKPIP